MGNSLIIKNSEQAPISSLRFCELLGDIFPKGLINVVTGGPDNGKFLVAHPDIQRIAVIGSVNTGIAIAKSAAPFLKNISLDNITYFLHFVLTDHMQHFYQFLCFFES